MFFDRHFDFVEVFFLLCIFSYKFSFVSCVSQPSDFMPRILRAQNPTDTQGSVHSSDLQSRDKREVLMIRFTEQTSAVYCPTL